jgi:hypothetical protein
MVILGGVVVVDGSLPKARNSNGDDGMIISMVLAITVMETVIIIISMEAIMAVGIVEMTAVIETRVILIDKTAVIEMTTWL